MNITVTYQETTSLFWSWAHDITKTSVDDRATRSPFFAKKAHGQNPHLLTSAQKNSPAATKKVRGCRDGTDTRATRHRVFKHLSPVSAILFTKTLGIDYVTPELTYPCVEGAE